mgnify:CR=1 FL=1
MGSNSSKFTTGFYPKWINCATNLHAKYEKSQNAVIQSWLRDIKIFIESMNRKYNNDETINNVKFSDVVKNTLKNIADHYVALIKSMLNNVKSINGGATTILNQDVTQNVSVNFKDNSSTTSYQNVKSLDPKNFTSLTLSTQNYNLLTNLSFIHETICNYYDQITSIEMIKENNIDWHNTKYTPIIEKIATNHIKHINNKELSTRSCYCIIQWYVSEYHLSGVILPEYEKVLQNIRSHNLENPFLKDLNKYIKLL